MMQRLWLLVGCLLAGTTSAMVAMATPPVPMHTQATLVSETRSVQPGQSFWIALRLDAKNGWHTYWRYPGDTGLATKITWRLPEGVRAGKIQWPVPERIMIGPTANYGYHGEVFLLTKIEAPVAITGSKTITVGADASWLACEKICVPESASLTLTLPVNAAAPEKNGPWQEKLGATRRRIPMPASWPATFSIRNNVLALNFPAAVADGAERIEFFPHAYGIIDNAAPQTLGRHQGQAVLKMTRGDMMADRTDRLSGTIVVTPQGGGNSVSKSFDITANRNDRTL